MEFYQENLRRTQSPLSLSMFYPSSVNSPPNPFLHTTAMGPSALKEMRYSPSVPDLQAHTNTICTKEVTFKGRKPALHYIKRVANPERTYTHLAPPILPKRTSSAGSSLKRAHTVTGHGNFTRKKLSDILPYAPQPLNIVKKSNPKMAWMQRQTNKRHVSTDSESEICPLDRASDERPRLRVFEVKGLNPRHRAFTEPPTPDSRDSISTKSPKRAISSAGYGIKAKKRLGSFSGKNNRSHRIRQGENEESGSAPKEHKGWKQRVFSFRNKETLVAHTEKQTLSVSSVNTVDSENTAANAPSSRAKGSAESSTKQVATAVDDNELQGDGTKSPEAEWVKTIPFEEVTEYGSEKFFNDSVVSKLGRMAKKERYTQRWKPPILNLNLKAVADAERAPVITSQGLDVWVAILLQGVLGGDVDLSLRNPSKTGLDVGILLDISSYTSPEGLQEMRTHAKKLVGEMDTSMDRIAVMTFSSSPRGKRNPSSKGRSNLKILNSSGSVAKKQLMEDITNINGGLQVDPGTRDVSAAVAAAIKILHQMSLDTNKYGSRRTGHLFLITSKLDDGELTGDFEDITVHVLGVGAVFNPKNSMGGNGWCVSLESSLENLGKESETTGPDEVEAGSEKFPDKGYVKVDKILKALRTNIDVGNLEDVKIFIQPGDGCEIKSVLGNTALGAIFPGERRTVVVKVRIFNINGWTRTDGINGNETIDFDELERQLEATLGELKTTILTAQATYFHPHLGTSGQTFTERIEVQINRYVNDCNWGLPSNALSSSSDSILGDSISARKEFVNTFLIQNIAACQESAMNTRKIIENMPSMDGIELILKEIEYRGWLEKSMYQSQTVSARMADSRGDLYSAPTVAAFEGLFEKRPVVIEREENERTISRSSSCDTVIYEPTNKHNTADSPFEPLTTTRTPDEARRLWMQLGGFKEVTGINSVSAFDSDLELEVGTRPLMKVNSGGGSPVTLRDVRETDFSPWIL